MICQPEFIYFDLGRVLLDFDNARICPQVADAAGVPLQAVKKFINNNDFQHELETGRMSFAQVFQRFQEATGTAATAEHVELAANNIFSLRGSMIPLIAALRAAQLPIGIISNTSASHWRFVTDGRYRILPGYFDCWSLSFEVGTMKPDPAIFAAATRQAATAPEKIFFTDDRIENVEGARQFGFDAVHYQSALQISDELHRRGVRFNF